MLVGQVQVKGVEDYPFFTIQRRLPNVTKVLRGDNDLRIGSHYCPLMVKGWQYKGAFVIQFRPEADIEAGRFEGRVEHMASYTATRFHSLDELLGFIASVLTEVKNAEPR